MGGLKVKRKNITQSSRTPTKRERSEAAFQEMMAPVFRSLAKISRRQQIQNVRDSFASIPPSSKKHEEMGAVLGKGRK